MLFLIKKDIMISHCSVLLWQTGESIFMSKFSLQLRREITKWMLYYILFNVGMIFDQ